MSDIKMPPLPNRPYVPSDSENIVDLYSADQMHAYASDAVQANVPDGWVLVPVVPTNEMTSAMADALEDPENERSSWDLAENMYGAMLSAIKKD